MKYALFVNSEQGWLYLPPLLRTPAEADLRMMQAIRTLHREVSIQEITE